jgi:hypothetical protein
MTNTSEQVIDDASTASNEHALELFSSMFNTIPSQVPVVVRDLAERGNIPLLEMLLGSGLICSKRSEAAEMACAIVPLIEVGKAGDTRSGLASRWLKALDLDTLKKLGAQIPYVVKKTSIHEMLYVLGADPLAIVKSSHPDFGSFTALGYALHELEVEKTIEMCKVLLSQGRDPVACYAEGKATSIFELMAQAEMDDRVNLELRVKLREILEDLQKADLPAAWEYQAGNGLMRYIKAPKPISFGPERALIAMLSVARFDDPKDWVRVMRLQDNGREVTDALLGENQQDYALRVVANMKRDGVDMDELWGTMGSKYGGASKRHSMPFLHAAVASDLPNLVEALLEAGCNPGPRPHVLYSFGQSEVANVMREALDVAKPGSACEKLIRVWKVKQSIAGILDSTSEPGVKP